MYPRTIFIRLALAAVALAITPLSAFAVVADLSGSLTGRIDSGEAFVSFGDPNGNGFGDAFGFGEIPHLGKTQMHGIIEYHWWDPIHTANFFNGFQLLAANGDIVFAACGPTTIDEFTGELSWDIIFVGGTGRFAEAIGTATLVFHLPPQYWVDGGYEYSYWVGEYELIDAWLNY